MITINDTIIGANKPFTLIAGPCSMESEEIVMESAYSIKKIAEELDIPYVFKVSFDKANRSSIHSFRGQGIDKGLEILQRVKNRYEIPVTTDVHESYQIEQVAEVVDIIQIPAFLCRQTDLLMAAAKTGKVVNVKKGQFLAPWDVENIIVKLKESGAEKILLTERGSSFGYNNLVVDMRSLPIMRGLGVPVVFDATHSVQIPGGNGTSSGGRREYVSYLAQAAVATGIDALFMEVHPDPDQALCDGANMLKINEIAPVLKKLKQIDAIVKG
jgi:2-dehydro-3-deoxyphosphooctonate aldolase (KDO 8-P synthase)